MYCTFHSCGNTWRNSSPAHTQCVHGPVQTQPRTTHVFSVEGRERKCFGMCWLHSFTSASGNQSSQMFQTCHIAALICYILWLVPCFPFSHSSTAGDTLNPLVAVFCVTGFLLHLSSCIFCNKWNKQIFIVRIKAQNVRFWGKNGHVIVELGCKCKFKSSATANDSRNTCFCRLFGF